MLKKWLLVPLGVLLSAGVVTTLILVIPKIREQGKLPSLKAVVSPEDDASVADQEAILNWQLYENVGYRLRFQYPAEFKIEELHDLGPHYFQINILGANQRAQAIFMIKTLFEPAEELSFIGTSPQGTETMNGLTWDFYNFPQGYSNSPPFTVYQGEKAGILYSFKFYNTISDKLRDQMMTTVEILPPPQN